MTTDLQPTDYAFTLAKWRERNRGLWTDYSVERPSISVKRQAICDMVAAIMYGATELSDSLVRALYAAIQAEGRR